MFQNNANQSSRSKVKPGIIDCDIHNELPTPDALNPYLSERWLKHHKTVGLRTYHSLAAGSPYPQANPLVARADAWPPSGHRPGSDLSFMQEQLLDAHNIEYGILNCMYPVGGQLNDEYAAALATAVNNWQIAEWLEKDSRLRASIVVPYENAELAAAEIERLAEHPGFVQVLLYSRTNEPLGRRKYWKIYETAEKYGIPIGIHGLNRGGNPVTSSGWLSHYAEVHTSLAPAAQAQVVSFVCEGVFERFPKLRVVMVETGFAWIPALMWRLDKQWKRLKDELPHLKRLPSEYIQQHIKCTTQPMEEPSKAKQFIQLMEHLGTDDMLMFATDYPHWDFDDPSRAFPIKLSADLEQKIMSENAKAVYNFEKGRGV